MRILLALAAAIIMITTTQEAAMASPHDGMTLAWSDDFSSWDPAWSTRQTAYTDDQPCAKADVSCARTVDGKMVLSVKKDPENPGKYLTGHVGTENRAEFDAYGYFEAKVKFPAIPGILSGWWLQTTEDYIPDQAEIDIAECGGRRNIQHTIWYRDLGQGIGEFHEPPPHTTTRLERGAQADWHRYGVLWEPDGYTFFVDRKPTVKLTGGLSSRPKFLVLSMKLPKYMLKVFDPALIQKQKMYVDWVRVWQ